MGRRGHRYHYNPHDASPHYGVLNLLIVVATLICVWNVWTAPPPESTPMMNQPRKYDVTDGSAESPNEQGFPKQQQGYKSNLLPLFSRVERNGPFLPVQTDKHGNKFIVLTSNKQALTQLANRPLTSTKASQKVIQPDHTPGQYHNDHAPTEKMEQTSSVSNNEDPEDRARHASALGKKMKSKPYGFYTPLFEETVDSKPRSSLQQSEITTDKNSSPRRRWRFRWFSWIYAIAITGSIVAGGVFAKRALDKIDRWEQLSKEDSLAYDLAYTLTLNDEDMSYGSFAPSEWTGDYLDRFDV